MTQELGERSLDKCWIMQQMQSAFESRNDQLRYESKFGNDSEQAKIDMDSKFENPVEYEDYWEKVDNHLKTGRIRLLFVADEIPSELKQIVEFLNQQMNPAEVLAIEIKQHTGQEQSTFVPRVIGQLLKQFRQSNQKAMGRIFIP